MVVQISGYSYYYRMLISVQNIYVIAYQESSNLL